MTSTQYWFKQTADLPLFPDLIWSKPQSKNHAGKLLIIGGNKWGFAAPAGAYIEATNAGIGTARVLLPDAVFMLIGNVLENASSAVSTPSGGFSKRALHEFLEQSNWADGVLLAGDLGRNSETAILIEQYLTKFKGQITLTKDAADYVVNLASFVMKRPNTTLVLSLGQLQKIATSLKLSHAITTSMDLVRLVSSLHELTEHLPVNIIVKHYLNILVATNGRVSSTKISDDLSLWRLKIATHCAVWWLQNPVKVFESLTTAII